jgi:hypothetical protein
MSAAARVRGVIEPSALGGVQTAILETPATLAGMMFISAELG